MKKLIRERAFVDTSSGDGLSYQPSPFYGYTGPKSWIVACDNRLLGEIFALDGSCGCLNKLAVLIGQELDVPKF